MKIQIPYKCKKYKPNDNLNKTCANKTRCKIYYDEICIEYKEKENEIIYRRLHNSNMV